VFDEYGLKPLAHVREILGVAGVVLDRTRLVVEELQQFRPGDAWRHHGDFLFQVAEHGVQFEARPCHVSSH